RLSIAQYLYFDYVADFAAAQGVGEVVKVLDRLIAEPYEDIARLQSGFFRRRTGFYVGKLHAVFNLAKVGNGTKVRTIAATAAARSPGRRLFFHSFELRAVGRGSQLFRDAGNQREQSHSRVGVDLVPSVGGLVIIRVEA